MGAWKGNKWEWLFMLVLSFLFFGEKQRLGDAKYETQKNAKPELR